MGENIRLEEYVLYKLSISSSTSPSFFLSVSLESRLKEIFQR